MDRLSLLRNEGLQDDQVLETDVMRFVAVIGIVFWIIFAIVKSIPFNSPNKPPSVETNIQEPQLPTSPLAKGARQKPKPSSPLALKQGPVEKPVAPMKPGIRLQFRSLEDLLTLMRDQRVKIYCRARARGFDLVFAGRPQGQGIGFEAGARLPQSLWEIKSGKDHAYFVDLMTRTYPSIRTFPEKQVFIHFVDTGLERRVVEALERLKKEGRSGVLSVTGKGEVVFE